MQNRNFTEVPIAVNGTVVGKARVNPDGRVEMSVIENHDFMAEFNNALYGPHVSVDDLKLEDFVNALGGHPKGKHVALPVQATEV